MNATCRCGIDETDFHLFFSCHYVHAVWFASPLGLRVEGLIQQGIDQIEDALHHMMAIYKTSSSVALIFNILWSIWKARNNLLFNKKQSTLQVLHVAKTLLYTGDMEQGEQGRLISTPAVVSHSTTLVAFDRNRVGKGPNIYTDAAWKSPSTSSSICAGTRSKTEIGIFMHWINEGTMHAILVEATCMAHSTLQAEAQALEFAAQLCQVMKMQHPNF